MPLRRTALGEADDPHPLERLHTIAELRRELDREEGACVRQARNLGLSWHLIAVSLGVSRQAVHKKYGRK